MKSLQIMGKTFNQMDMTGRFGNTFGSTKFGELEKNIVLYGDASIAGFGAMFGTTIPWKYT